MAIESMMYMGLGFLLAALITVLAIPLVHSRAQRLTIRRLEASLPQSPAEVQADKDLLRAEHAISTRRLELKIEQLTVNLAGRLVELGKKQDAVNRLRIQRDALNLEVVALKTQSKRSARSIALTAQASMAPSVPAMSLSMEEVMVTRGMSETRSTQADTWTRRESTNDSPTVEYPTEEDTWTRDQCESAPIVPTRRQSDVWPRHDRVGGMAPVLTLSTFKQSTEENTWIRDQDDPSETATSTPPIEANKCRVDKNERLVRIAGRLKKQTPTRRSLASSHVSAN